MLKIEKSIFKLYIKLFNCHKNNTDLQAWSTISLSLSLSLSESVI